MFNKASDKSSEKTRQSESMEGKVMVEDREAALTEQAADMDFQEEAETGARSGGETDSEDWQGKYRLLQDQFTRLAADFDNFRKRVREEQEALARYGAQKSVLELLPVLDNLERAAASLSENSEPKTLYQSFGMIEKNLLDRFDALGVKKIQALGQPFDPMFHEAVSQQPSAEFPESTVMYETQTGYMLNDKVLRPAMVVVSTGPADDAGTPGASAEGDAGEAGNPFKK